MNVNSSNLLSRYSGRVAYVVKRYPRFSETFVVNEILSHEQAGLDIDIFSLRPPVDTHFQSDISKVRAPVHYLSSGSVKSPDFWEEIQKGARRFPGIWDTLPRGEFATVIEMYQAIQMAGQIRERGIRHLHAHFATSATTVSRLAAGIAGISYSFTAHAKDIFHDSVHPADLQSKIDDASFVVTVSDFNQKWLSRHFGNSQKIVRIYNGLDLSLFHVNPLQTSTRCILAIGRLVAKKGFTHLIDACRILRDKNVEFRCEIVGGGELDSALRDQVSRLSLNEYVHLAGPIPQNQVREKLRNATMLVAPCVVGEDGNRDGLPTVITEALASGTPCIATAVTGIPEIIHDQESGLIVRQGSADDLARAIRQLLVNDQLRRSLAERGREIVEQQFNIHQNVAKLRERFPVLDTRSPPLSSQLLEAV